MRREIWAVASVVVAAAAAAPLAAQETFVFRYAPSVGALVRTYTEQRAVTTFNGFPALPDGATLEVEARIYGHQRVIGEEDGTLVVEATIDSTRNRRRVDQGPWRDVADSSLVGHPAVARLTSQFSVSGFRSAAPTDGDVFRPVGAMVAGLDFAFPGEPVAVGQTFPAGGRIHMRVRAAEETGVAVDETVFGDLALTLDSVVRREDDALAYLSFNGALTPRTTSQQAESGASSGTYTGRFAGRLVWSRSWNAFVSGVARVRVDGRVTAETPRGLVAASAVWDTTVRHQVRP
jgi:hypothetical protein